jgi:hypothetical protein
MLTDGRTGGQTNMTKLIVAFRNFANAPKNVNTQFVRNAEIIVVVICAI